MQLETLIRRLRDLDADRILYKFLAPNDNSKNQVYLGSDFSVLNVLPIDNIRKDESERAGAIRDRFKADARFFWIDESGKYNAPNANFILYPKYPEVRFSGFLSGCRESPSKVMNSRSEGRVLLLGISQRGEILAHAAGPRSAVAAALRARNGDPQAGVFFEITLRSRDSRNDVLRALKAIYEKNWVSSKKLDSSGNPEPYKARNGGGYTLEAELGISPNGFSEPDYLGWEIKQFGIVDRTTYKAKSPVTLMTPEPTGGLYRSKGVSEFLGKYGYPDQLGRVNRINFGGIYRCSSDVFNKHTGLRMELAGFDYTSGRIIDADGGIALVDTKGNIAAKWGFQEILNHWKRKHAKAMYVPSIFQEPPPEYAFGAQILVCEGADVSLFLNAIAEGVIYYDPGIKMEQRNGKPKVKRRSQFRIKQDLLGGLYRRSEYVDLESI